jgi:hypothetical protein
MREKIARFLEDHYYLALIYIRSLLERLHILNAPLPSGVVVTWSEKDMQELSDLLETVEQFE